jgi:hypothetical protein
VTEFERDTIAALGAGYEDEAPYLCPIDILGWFISELRREDVRALISGDDPESYDDVLRDVEVMQRELKVLLTKRPQPVGQNI